MPKTERPMMTPVHPGQMLKADFLDPLGVSQYRLAQAIGVPTPPHQRDRSRNSSDQR